MALTPYGKTGGPSWPALRFVGSKFADPRLLGLNTSQSIPMRLVDLVHASITVSRQPWYAPSPPAWVWERNFRATLVRAFLELSPKSANHWQATPNYHALEASEKGAISFLLGCVLTNALARRQFSMWHLIQLTQTRMSNVKVSSGSAKRRSRPDFVLADPSTSDWCLFEVKGRSGSQRTKFGTRTKANDLLVEKAMSQLLKQGPGSKAGLPPPTPAATYQRLGRDALATVVSIAALERGGLMVEWIDPPSRDAPEDPPTRGPRARAKRHQNEVQEEGLYTAYYRSVLQMLGPKSETERRTVGNTSLLMSHSDEADIDLGLAERLTDVLVDGAERDVLEAAASLRLEIGNGLYVDDDYTLLGGDGVLVLLGDSWRGLEETSRET